LIKKSLERKRVEHAARVASAEEKVRLVREEVRLADAILAQVIAEGATDSAMDG
jgi:hypothetical protein